MTYIKMCGCTSYDDAARALDAGADAVGMIFGLSPRQISLAEAAAIAARLDPFAVVVGVFTNPTLTDIEAALAVIPTMRLQFSGEEPALFCESVAPGQYLKAFHLGHNDEAVLAALDAYPNAMPLFDTYDADQRGGTGRSFEWSALEVPLGRSFAVAGGLTPENVGECIESLRPRAVDVRTGIETNGTKDEQKMRAFVRAVRQADAQT